MYTASLITLLALASGSLAGRIHLSARQARPCFVIGNSVLPEETADIANSLQVTCDTSTTTISGVPDVSSNGVTFSSVNFEESNATPLQFALDNFATGASLANEDLGRFQDELNVYLATEAGIRSVSGSLAIKVPKFFLAYQVARIKTAQGVPNPEPGQQVLHLMDKVLKNAAGEDAALLDQVRELSTQLS